MSEVQVKYVKFVPDNLQEELDFIGVMYESGVISLDNFKRMQGMLELAGHIPNDDPENYDTGNDFLFSIHGQGIIDSFVLLMEKKMPNCCYKMSDKPMGRLIDKEDRIKKENNEDDKNS